MHGYGFRYNRLDLIRHPAELPSMAPSVPNSGLSVEEVEANAEGMGSDADYVFFGKSIRHHRHTQGPIPSPSHSIPES